MKCSSYPVRVNMITACPFTAACDSGSSHGIDQQTTNHMAKLCHELWSVTVDVETILFGPVYNLESALSEPKPVSYE